MTEGFIRVDGLIELQRGLRTVATEAPRELRVLNLDVAEYIAGKATSAASSVGGAAAKTAPSIKAAAEQRAAKIRFGGKGYPFAGGAEFGAYHDQQRHAIRHGHAVKVRGWNQFKPWRGNRHTQALIEFDEQTTGYFIYPTIRGSRTQVLDLYGDGMVALAARYAFPD